MSGIRRVAVIINLEWLLVHHHQVFAGIQRFARENGRWECSVSPHADLLMCGDEPGELPDGIIARATPRLAEMARRAGVPLVNVWLNSRAKNLPTVVHDAEASGRMAARHLLERGFRNFGYMGLADDNFSRLQLAGFRAVLGGAGCGCSENWVARRYARKAENWQQFQTQLGQWIDQWPLPIGVFVAHDLLCRYLAEACALRGMEIPLAVALIGSFNESVVSGHTEPALSSIDFGFERVGHRAAALLDAMMDGRPVGVEPIRIPPADLIARRSSDAFAVSDPVVAQALRFISGHSHEEIDVELVADHVFTTRRTLARSFQKCLGRTVHETITKIRLDRVKQRLLEPNPMIKTIATECGFRDAIQLCKIFQRVEGASPSEYRAERLAGNPHS
ncbi:MAG TPA: DNA-binding transcriptional regulator [Tepidisphaeraceae bacterium]|jgi:LacI family transcriptional regulator|nr:DNA-binding transcriptional regulator [Tepidisphaeraceae bacterium]